MRAPGMIRKVDDLGRIVIPAEIRQAMELSKGDPVEMFLQEDQLVLRKFVPSCIFCGGVEGLVTYSGKNICGNCVDIIKKA